MILRIFICWKVDPLSLFIRRSNTSYLRSNFLILLLRAEQMMEAVATQLCKFTDYFPAFFSYRVHVITFFRLLFILTSLSFWLAPCTVHTLLKL